MKGELVKALKPFSELITSAAYKRQEIQIITGSCADGLLSASIIATTLKRLGARCNIRTVSELDSPVIDIIRSEDHDFHIFTDLKISSSAIENSLQGRWMAINQYANNLEKEQSDNILGTEKLGIDGRKEITSAGLAYLVSSLIDVKNKDQARLAIVSAVSKRQDEGEKKSLIGLNKDILNDAESAGQIYTNNDILLIGRETKPVHEALSETPFPFIEGVTLNKENSYKILHQAGLRLKENNRWRVPSDLSFEEKLTIIDAISKYINSIKASSIKLNNIMMGKTYVLLHEDPSSPLRDAREFSTLLNACSIHNRTGVGIGICMGDRNMMLSEGEGLLVSFKKTLGKFFSTIFSEKWRLHDDGKSVLVNVEGLVSGELLETVSLLLCNSPTMSERIIFTRTMDLDGNYRISASKSIGFGRDYYLAEVMASCAERFGGSTEGNDEKTLCKIPSASLDGFISCIRQSTGNTDHDVKSQSNYNNNNRFKDRRG